MTSRHRDPEGRSLKLTRRRLLRLAGGGALAASSGGWLSNALHASSFPYTCAPEPGCLAAFNPPGFMQDFPPGSAEDAALRRQWNLNVNQFTETAILGAPWASNVGSPNPFYFNPLTTPVPDPATTPVPAKPIYKLVEWTAFPNRLTAYLGDEFSQEELFELADNGRLKNGTTLPTIPENVCPSIGLLPGPEDAFSPYGARGWQDEYNEWAVERRDGEIHRVMFTSENPEYWHTLWAISPERVRKLYSDLIGQHVPLDDLKLTVDGKPLRHPNGNFVYNPLNKWNTGTELKQGSGGAIHLTSPPNNLAAEIGIGAAATSLYIQDANPQELICCAQYGQNFRHSDPHIGFTINQAVAGLGRPITIVDPVALYMQWPDFQNVQLPPDLVRAGVSPYDFWHWKRFAERPAHQPGVMGLHAEFKAPRRFGQRFPRFKMSDIRIDGRPLKWASQIATTFQVGLVGVLTEKPDDLPLQRKTVCIPGRIPPPDRVSPLYLLSCEVALAQIAQGVPTEMYSAAPVTQPGVPLHNMALIMNGGSIDTEVQFLVRNADGTHSEAPGVSVKNRRFIENQPTPVGDISNILVIDIEVEDNAPLGQLDMRLGSEFNPAGRAFLTIEENPWRARA